MLSDGSSSDSDISNSSLDINRSEICYNRRRQRRESVTSVCTHPDEDAYVMVLQNRSGLYDSMKCAFSLRELCDITFVVGKDKKHVHGVRAILGSRSRLFYQLILAHQNTKNPKNKSNLKKTLLKLACVKPGGTQTGSDIKSRLTIPMEAFDPESFQRLMTYVHCGTLTVDARTVIGLLNAAYTFGFSELRQACWDFALGCVVRSDNLQDLFVSARQYSHHKMTKDLMKTMRQYTADYPDLLKRSQTLAELGSLFTRYEESESFVTT